MNNKDIANNEGLTEWRCTYCPAVATTIRQGSAVCYHHATELRMKVGLAERILNRLRKASRLS